MKVVIAGEVPFVPEVGELVEAAGHDVTLYLVEDFMDAISSGYVMESLADMDVAIELHNEAIETKEELLLALGQALPSDALILTSALPTSTTQAASWVPRPERVVGFGLMPPITADQPVELAAALQTNPDFLAQAETFFQDIGLQPMMVKDGPGLVRARTLCCLINEAISALDEGVATAVDIDRAMQLGTNYPRGLLDWADYVGLDAVLGVMSGLHREYGESRYRPSPLLRHMVLAGKLGRKAGEGFFEYEL